MYSGDEILFTFKLCTQSTISQNINGSGCAGAHLYCRSSMAGEGLCEGGQSGPMEQDPISSPPLKTESASGFLSVGFTLHCDLRFSLMYYSFSCLHGCVCLDLPNAHGISTVRSRRCRVGPGPQRTAGRGWKTAERPALAGTCRHLPSESPFGAHRPY